MALPIFAITIFVSAFLLFLVQPLVGKLILPKLGGAPMVWNTCMVFFQSALLAGYAYTHSVSTRLKLRQQLMLHGALLVAPIAMMIVFPIYATVKEWSPPTDANPIPNTLFLLLMIVGVPFFVVSTSAPLLQKWFAYSGHETARDPYFLYAASNIGSLLSLAVYPILIEPFTFLQNQAYIWFGGYVALAGLILYCAYTIYKTAPTDEQIAATEAAAAASEAAVSVSATEASAAPTLAPPAENTTAVKAGPGPGGRGIHRKKGAKLPGPLSAGTADEPRSIERDEEPGELDGQQTPMTAWRRIRWILLAAIPSSLMLGVTSFVSTDLSPFPLVWVIPLSLYLLSFVIVYTKFKRGNFAFDYAGKGVATFGAKPLTFHDMTMYVLQPIGLIALCIVILRRGFDPFVVTGATMIAFFATALACHGQLAKDRPSIKHLTEYFLLMSVGGMVGGLFNGIFAPIMFQTGVYEFHVAIVVACFVRPTYTQRGWFDDLILSAFPGFLGWVVQQGDEMAKSMGKAAPRTAYLFSSVIDVVFGLFILGITYYMRTKFGSSDGSLGKLLKFFALDPRAWSSFAFSVLAYGIPLVFCFFFSGRPVRFGLSVLAVLLANLYFVGDDERVVEARRTYFGVLKVMRDTEDPKDEEEQKNFRTAPFMHEGKEYPWIQYQYTYLMHGTTYHGRNYLSVASHEALAKLNPLRKDPFAKVRVDLSRLATTYYHRYGPVGVVMERDNWFPGAQNSFHADAKLPTMMVSNITASIGIGAIPTSVFVDAWSEPAFATIGLGSGTMVSYARPFQHMTYYEIDEVIREFSLPMPTDGGPIPEGRFTYLQNAVRRGVNAEVIMGDARLSLEPNREKTQAEQIEKDRKEGKDVKGNPHSFLYSVPDFKQKDLPYTYTQGKTPMRDGYYRVINVDAFSSDAIPVHLVTKEAIEIYMSKLTKDGILCVHTSNRHMDLVRPVARIAMELSKESQAKGGPEINCLVGKDGADKEKYMGHFSSEYVMIYRGDTFSKWVDKLAADRKKLDGKDPAPGQQILNSVVTWYDPYKEHTEVRRDWFGRNPRIVLAPITKHDSLWTDDYSYILGVLR